MRTLISLLFLTAAVFAQSPAKIGKGCSTAYFIDNDCDGYGVAVRADGNYTTVGNVGDKPDADDTDAAVNTSATTLNKYGSLAGFLAYRGYPTSRIWYVAPTTATPPGNNPDCAAHPNDINHPCENMGPMAAAYHDGKGGTVIYRGGAYRLGIGSPGDPYPNYPPTATSASSPLVVMAYPGEAVTISNTAVLDTAYWPTGVNNVIVDGFIFKQFGDCVNQNGTNGLVFRRNEIVGCVDGIRQTDHTQNLLIEGNVFHDNGNHAIYLGYSSPTAAPHAQFADFDFAQDAINYANGTSSGAANHITIRNNLSYRDGNGGYEPFHFNAYIDYLTVDGNIVHSGGGTGLGFQTGIYHATVQNNVIFNNSNCAMTWSLYGPDYQPATHRWNTIVNNTFWAGSHTDTFNGGKPTCGILFNDYSGSSGSVSVTSGSTTVRWASGYQFLPSYWKRGEPIILGSTTYYIDAVTDASTLTLTTPYAGATYASQYYFKATAPGSHWIKDFTIKNNIIATDNWSPSYASGVPIVFSRNSFPNTHTISNNLIWNASTVQAASAADYVMQITNDAYPDASAAGFYTLTQFQANSPTFSANAAANPGFANASLSSGGSPQSFDFHLLSGSPAINLGATTGAPTSDIQGNLRAGQPDAGAYEYGGAGAPTGSAPVISSFTANPAVVAPGGSSVLSWSVSGATSISIDHSVGVVTGASVSVNPTTTTTYTLTATNSAGSANKATTISVSAPGVLTAVSGNNQSGSVGQTLANPFVVAAKDANGNPVPGIPVTFAVSSGAGTLSASQVNTNTSGQASTLLTLGSSAGATTVTATSSGLSGSPVTFTATATAASSSGMTWTKTGPNWNNGAIASSWPYFRGYNRLVYDPALGRTLAAESENATTIYSNSYWAYDSTSHTWSQKTTTGTSDSCNTPAGSNPPGHPANRHPYHGLAYDSTRSQMYLFGGVCQGTPFSDTWAYKSAANTWTQLSPSAQPTARMESAMTYDAARDVLVLYGGIAPYSQAGDTWQYAPSSNSWTQMSPSVTPGPLAGHSMVYDSVNQKVVLFGGYASWTGPALNGTWVYDAGARNWSNPNPATVPPALTFPAMTFDSKRALVVLYVGPSEMWTYNVATNQWSRLSVSGGPPVTTASGAACSQCVSMAYDASADKYILTSQDSSYYTATWELSPGGAPTTARLLDLNGDGVVNVVDVQRAINQTQDIRACKTADFNGDGLCNSVDVQLVVDKAIGK